MFLPLLVASFACVAIFSGEAKLVWRSSNDLYYFKNDKLSYNQTLETCTRLGGRVPSAGNRTDSEFLTQNSGEATWLFASKDRGGYRWSDSLHFIDPNMWAPYEPDCSGPCAAIVKQGQLYAVNADTPTAYTCQFDISSDIHLQKVLDHWKGFEPQDQQSLVEYVLRRKSGSSPSTDIGTPMDLSGLKMSLNKLQQMVGSTNSQLVEMRVENKKTVSSFRQALKESLSTLDSNSTNYNALLSTLVAL